jgi:hypothetical protein
MHDPIGVGHGGHLASEIVAAGVQGGDLFAYFCFWAGGTLRVSAFRRLALNCFSEIIFSLLLSTSGCEFPYSIKVKHTNLGIGR